MLRVALGVSVMERDCVCVWDADRDCVWLWVGDSVSVMLWLGDSVSVWLDESEQDGR